MFSAFILRGCFVKDVFWAIGGKIGSNEISFPGLILDLFNVGLLKFFEIDTSFIYKKIYEIL